MRVVLDTNILVAGLISPSGAPAESCDAWSDGRFDLLTCREQIAELRATLQKPKVAALIHPNRAGRLVKQIRKLAVLVEALPPVKRSPDPEDDFLLALCEAGEADYIVTGDKSGLLSLKRHKKTRIISAREFVALLE
jgi:uncharacterized protein